MVPLTKRRIHGTIIGSIVLALSLTPIGIADGRNNRHKTCVPSNGRVIAANTLAAAYSIPEKEGNGAFPEYRACLNSKKKLYYIGAPGVGSSTGTGGTTHITLVGHMVAYEQFGRIEERFPGAGSEKYLVIVFDLLTGHVLHEVPTGTRLHPDPRHIGVGGTETVLVKPNGSVAWLADTLDEEGRYQIHALDKNGNRLIASGPDIDPHSLALAGSTLYWTQDGQPHSTPLA